MVLDQQHTRIDIVELKAHLYKKIGQQKADKYFHLLNKLFSLQLSKSSFDKSCIRTIGRENLPLHNRLISSFVKNAASGKVAPPTANKLANSLNVKVTRNPNLQSLYGDAFPLSPRKSRSPRDRRSKDRPSPLGPNGSKVHHEQLQSPTELQHSVGSRPPVEVFSVEDGEEVVSGSPSIQSRSPVTAPLGISMKTLQARKTVYGQTGPKTLSCYSSFELPDNRYLKSRLKEKLEAEELTVSDNYVNLLNIGLNVYLKRLMEPCIGLARSRVTQNAPGFSGPGSYRFRPRIPSASTVSVSDFTVAMECDPCKLGVDWSALLEKINNDNLE